MSQITDFLKRLSIKKLLTIYILFFTFVPLTITYLYFSQFSTHTVMNNYLPNYLESIHSEFDVNMEFFVNKLNRVFLNITTYQDLYSEAIRLDSTDEEKKINIVNYLSNLLSGNEILGAVEIITTNHEIYRCILDPDFIPTDITQDFLSKTTNSTLYIQPKCLVDKKGTYYLPVGKKFINYYTQYEVGDIVLYIKEDALYNIYKNSAISHSSFFITLDDYVISCTDKTKIGKNIFIPTELHSGLNNLVGNDSKTVISQYTLKNKLIPANIKMLGVISQNEFYMVAGNLNKLISVMLLITLIISFFVAFFVSKNLLKEIVVLRKRMDEFNDFGNVPKFAKNTNEIWALELSFNNLVKQIKELLEKNNLEKEKQRISELKALQAQINPHFIYNALDIISWASKSKKMEKIEEMICALASYFRIGLHKGDNIISIKEEISHVNSYLTIEKMRFPNLFEVSFDIAEDILELKVLKIILQPLVENAIKHGFKEMKTNGSILITAEATSNQDIIFKVIDNGSGLRSNPLEIQTTMDNTTQGGYGIYNVQERLILEYGEGYGLTFESVPGIGTCVCVKIKKTC